MEETQAKLIVCREYCSISWGKALDAVGVPVGSNLRRPESIYYDLEIRELPGLDSSHPEQATQASEQSLADQSPLLPWTFLRSPTKMVAKERKLKISRAWVKVKTRRKILLIPMRNPQILLPLSSAKLLTQ